MTALKQLNLIAQSTGGCRLDVLGLRVEALC